MSKMTVDQSYRNFVNSAFEKFYPNYRGGGQRDILYKKCQSNYIFLFRAWSDLDRYSFRFGLKDSRVDRILEISLEKWIFLKNRNPFTSKWSGIFWQPVSGLDINYGSMPHARKIFQPGEYVSSCDLLNDVNFLCDKVCRLNLEEIVKYAWNNRILDGISKFTLIAASKIANDEVAAENIKEYFLSSLREDQKDIYKEQVHEIGKNVMKLYPNH